MIAFVTTVEQRVGVWPGVVEQDLEAWNPVYKSVDNNVDN